MSIFEQLIELVFPAKCINCGTINKGFVCEDCIVKLELLKKPNCSICGDHIDVGDECKHCKEIKPFYDKAVSLYEYSGVTISIIRHFKFGNIVKLSEIVRKVMKVLHDRQFAAIKDVDLVIPLPLSLKRLKQRGYNQAAIIADIVSDTINKPIRADILTKIKDIKPQADLGRHERAENIKGVYQSVPLKGENILLVDDIITTGSTVNEAAKTLKEAGAKKVFVLTLARAVIHDK